MTSPKGHIDPLAAGLARPDPATWDVLRRQAFNSREMDAFREGLRLPGLPDVRSAVLDDLSTYFRIDAEESLYRATHSYELSAAEWNARPERATKEAITDFYLSLRAWCFGLLWYSYLQAEGYAPPVAVIIAGDIAERPGARLLDFGSGTGPAAAMWRLLGYDVTLADISVPLLKFAAFRLQRRGIEAGFIDLNEGPPPTDTFDVVAAIQTFASVPDVSAVAAQLHRALRPKGTMYADFDVRKRSGSDSRLYDEDLPLRRAVQRAGFVQERNLSKYSLRFRRVEPSWLTQLAGRAHDAVVLGPPRRVWRHVRYGTSL